MLDLPVWFEVGSFVILGLILLKYVSESVAIRQREIETQLRDPKSVSEVQPILGPGGCLVL